jgi:hypothetical protein
MNKTFAVNEALQTLTLLVYVMSTDMIEHTSVKVAAGYMLLAVLGISLVYNMGDFVFNVY